MEILGFHHSSERNLDQKNYPIHLHGNYELLYFINGNVQFSVEGKNYKLRKGDFVLTRKSESHHVIFNSNTEYERIVISFDFNSDLDPYELLKPFNDRNLGEMCKYKSSEFNTTTYKNCFYAIAGTKDKEKQKAYLTVLLYETNEAFRQKLLNQNSNADNYDKSYEIIKYVNSHLYEDISLESISKNFYLSRSQLNRVFKKATGLSVWEYVKSKRLLNARDLIIHGQKPTAVSEKCGFKDYVSFYKAYKAKFGHSPKKDGIN